MQLTDSDKMFGIKHQVTCDDPNTPCVLDIVTISDLSSPTIDKV